MSTQRFPVRFTGPNRAMYLLGLRPATSYIEVTDDVVHVRMGVMFSATFRRGQVAAARDDHDRVRGWGVHGWAGTWLLNGSSSGVVRIEIEPAAQARAVGVPVTLRVLRIAVQ